MQYSGWTRWLSIEEGIRILFWKLHLLPPPQPPPVKGGGALGKILNGRLTLMVRPWYQISGLLLVVAVVFGAVCTYQFLDYDDAINIYANAEVTNFSPANLLRFWQKPYINLYIPITYNLWSVLTAISGHLPGGAPGQPNPYLFHGFSLLLHLLSASVVRLILVRLFHHKWAAWAGALLFAIHPVQVEAVCWATGLKDVLSGCLALLAIWQYIVYARSGVEGESACLKRHYALASLFFLLALLSKPGAVVTPALIGVIAYLLLGRRPAKIVMEMLPWLVLMAPVIWVTQSAQAEPNHVFIPSFWQRLLVGGDTFSFYLYKLVWPLTLGPDYGRTPQLVLGHSWVYLTGLLPYAALALLLWKAKRPPLAAVGIVICALLPVSGIMPFVFQQISTVADRYLYLAMLGPALGLAWLLSGARVRWAWGLTLLVLSLFGLKSWFQVRHWQDPMAFYDQALRVNPRSWTSYNNLGNLKADMDQQEEAVAAYEKAVAIDPNYADAYNNLGVARARLGQGKEAVLAFNRALEINPFYADASINLGDVYRGNGQGEEAIELYQWAISAEPSSVKAYRNLCAVYHELQKNTEAATCYNKLLGLEGGSAEIYSNMGKVYKDLDRKAEAVAAYRQALAIKPDQAEVYNNLGFLYAADSKYQEAIPFYEKAVALFPSHPQPMHNLGLTYEALGRYQEAIDWLQKAIAADAAFAPAFNDLSRIYLARQQFGLAVEYADRARDLGLLDQEQLQAVAPYRGQK